MAIIGTLLLVVGTFSYFQERGYDACVREAGAHHVVRCDPPLPWK